MLIDLSRCLISFHLLSRCCPESSFNTPSCKYTCCLRFYFFILFLITVFHFRHQDLAHTLSSEVWPGLLCLFLIIALSLQATQPFLFFKLKLQLHSPGFPSIPSTAKLSVNFYSLNLIHRALLMCNIMALSLAACPPPFLLTHCNMHGSIDDEFPAPTSPSRPFCTTFSLLTSVA